MGEQKTLFIIDAMAMAYRTFYGLGRAGLTTAAGKPVTTLYGTALFLNKLVREQNPDFWVAAGDSPQATFRHDIYPDYKGHRDKMPDDLRDQIPDFWRLLKAFQMPVITREGFEADDIIGSLAKKYGSQELKVYIVSGDKDFFQLINDHVVLFSPKKNQDPVIVDPAGVKERFQVDPHQMIDCLALMGDSADNIPGIKGIGEKGAAKLISEFGNLEKIYENIDQVKGKKLKENLEEGKESGFLSRELVTIKTDLTIDESLDEFKIAADAIESSSELKQFYEEFEFQQLLASNLGIKTKKTSSTVKAEPTSNINILEPKNSRSLAPLMEQLENAQFLNIQTITNGINIINHKAIEAWISVKPDETWRLDLNNSEILSSLKQYFEQSKPQIRGHGLKFQLQLLWNTGINPKGSLKDTLIMDYLLDSNQTNHGFSALRTRYLGEKETIPLGLQAHYVGLMFDKLSKQVFDKGISKVLDDIEMPLVPILAKMEHDGVYLDADHLNSLSQKLGEKEATLTQEIYDIVGKEFNINSTKQLQVILFEELKLQDTIKSKIKKTKTGFSTDESVLTKLIHHPIAQKLLDYRETTKLKSTYVDALPQHINPKSGRLHAKFNQAVAATGRLSSDNPNIQNIPMHSAMGREIRKAFKSQDEDGLLLSADYSQIEIRLLAAFSKAEPLIQSFKGGHDIHRATAAKIFHINESEVTGEMRSQAKSVNFGILYGMGPSRLSTEIGVSMKQAKQFIEKYYDAFPEIHNYIESLKEQAEKKGYSETFLGRRRPIKGLHDANKAVAARWQNIAVNSPIQGAAADLIKLAMIQIEDKLRTRGFKTRMLIQIHDELVFETNQEELREVQKVVRESMEKVVDLGVPLKIDMGFGHTWLEAH